MESIEGRLHVIAPVWFNAELLKGEDFDREQYITDLSRYVPLETICTQLASYLNQLKSELVEVINANYNDFVGLAGQMSGAEGAIIRMVKPLTDLRKRMDIVERGIESELRLLSTTLDRRQKLKAARRSLEAMQASIQVSAKIEKLMNEIDGAMRQADASQQSALLERAAREIGKLDLLSKENPELELIRLIIGQNEGCTAQIIRCLETSLRSLFRLQQADHASVLRLLNAFSLMGQSRLAESIIRDALLKPLLNSITAEIHEDRDLKQLVEKYPAKVDLVYDGLFVVVRDASSGLQHYDFLGSCILSAFHTHILHAIPTVFSPGKPDAFLKNFKACMQLIERLEMCCATVSGLEQFRGGDALKTFMKAWNLQVYFAMRFQEIAGVLDNAFESESFSPKSSADGFSFTAVSVWLECLQQCFNPQITTYHLSDQFLKLFFKLLSRFEHWLSSHINQLEQRSDGQESSMKFPQRNEDLALFERDIGRALTALRPGFFLEGIDDVCHEAVKSAVKHFVERMQKLQERLLDVVGERLLLECTAIVKKSVGTAASSMFRPSGERPTVSNEYVKRQQTYDPFCLLDPLRFFLETSAVSTHVDSDVQRRIKIHVAKGMCLVYRQALMDNLSFWEKSRMSLLRINKGRMAMTSDSATDSAKGDELANVCHQHWLDVFAFGQILKDFEITALDEYRELLDAIISKKEAHENP